MNARPERVFGAFCDAEILRRWWGPAGFTNTIHEFEFRSGGIWRYTMHGPDGNDYDNVCEFGEIVPPERVVIVHLRPMHRFTLTVSLHGLGERTELTWRQQFDEPLPDRDLEQFLRDANEQNLDRLAACILDMPIGGAAGNSRNSEQC